MPRPLKKPDTKAVFSARALVCVLCRVDDYLLDDLVG